MKEEELHILFTHTRRGNTAISPNTNPNCQPNIENVVLRNERNAVEWGGTATTRFVCLLLAFLLAFLFVWFVFHIVSSTWFGGNFHVIHALSQAERERMKQIELAIELNRRENGYFWPISYDMRDATHKQSLSHHIDRQHVVSLFKL